MNIEYTIIGVNLLIFLVAPYLPNVVYTHFIETYFGIILLLIAALYSITYGYLASVSAFIGVASLYSESHARKARSVKRGMATNSFEFEEQLQPAPELVPNEVHPSIETPGDETVSNVPEKNDNLFEPVGRSVNEKDVLPTVSDTREAEDIYVKDNLAESMLKD